MDWLKIVSIVVEAIVAIAVAIIVPQVRNWLVEKIGEQRYATIHNYIESFVKAAEQVIPKDEDKTGALRKEYVIGLMGQMGIEVNETTNAIVEGCVLGLKKGA